MLALTDADYPGGSSHMFCSHCGKPLDSNASQCQACGTMVPGALNPPDDWFRDTEPEDGDQALPEESPFEMDAPEVAGKPTWPLLLGIVVVAVAIVAVLAYQLLNLDLTPAEIDPEPAPTSQSATPTASAPATSAAPPATTTPTSTPTRSPSSSASTPEENLPAGVSECQPGVWVNASASCPFAAEIAAKVNRKMTTPVSFDAHSPVTNQTYLVNCTRNGALITCANEGTSRIYIAAE